MAQDLLLVGSNGDHAQFGLPDATLDCALIRALGHLNRERSQRLECFPKSVDYGGGITTCLIEVIMPLSLLEEREHVVWKITISKDPLLQGHRVSNSLWIRPQCSLEYLYEDEIVSKKTLLFAFLFLALSSFLLVTECHRRRSPPIAPVYLASILSDQTSSGVGVSANPLITYHYVASASPIDIITFYKTLGSCNVGAKILGREICQGKASPFGEYTIYIYYDELSQESTSYTIEIRWNGCPFSL
jgi:hypothetical protein